MEFLATEKQIAAAYIGIRNWKDDHVMLGEIWKRTNDGQDLGDKLKTLTSKQISAIIQAYYLGHQSYAKVARKILTSLNF